ncbi:MAG: hypothetical protein ABIM99_06420 [Candidatus Dojkabacteria bacterium]
MADEQKKDTKKEETKTSESTESKSDAARNALFIVISLLVIVFLIGLALVINRGLNNNVVNTTADNTGLINSDTNPPANTTNNTQDSNTDSSKNSDNAMNGEDVMEPDSKTSDNAMDGEDVMEPDSKNTDNTPETNSDTPSDASEGASTTSIEESSDTTNSSVLPSGHTEDGYKKSLSTQTEINMAGYWIPTQYIAGDIPASNGKYTVQYGDTLWWIAAGHYGDPFKWTTIESSNYAQIGFLPNGEHALIFPNQVLVLP